MTQPQLDLKSYPTRATQPSKLSQREKLAKQMAEFEQCKPITVLRGVGSDPYPHSTRKQLPDIAERHAKKAKEASKQKQTVKVGSNMKIPKDMLCLEETMKKLGYGDCNGNNHKRFTRDLDAGLLPNPDWSQQRADGHSYRYWKPETLDNFLQLKEIVERHV